MACKLTVREIAQANEDLDTLSRLVTDAFVYMDEHKSKKMVYTAAYERLSDLIKALMNSEVTVKG